jgi:O-antigen/teichoic acid export membrane protein
VAGMSLFGWSIIVPATFDGAKVVIAIFGLFYFANTFFGPTAIYLTAGHSEMPVFVVSILSGVLNVCLNFLLIPVLAESGAALATMISMTATSAVLFGIIARRYGMMRVVSFKSIGEITKTAADRLGL